MPIRLDYGKEGLTLDLPDALADVLDILPAPALPDSQDAVDRAVRNPPDTLPLETLARGKRRPCVVVSDLTRPVPNSVLLPPVLDALQRAGVTPKEVTILFATGLHRPMSEPEIAFSLGPEITSKCRIVNHVGKDPRTNLLVGDTSTGVPAWLDRHYVESDLRILVGLVEPHVMAGYSGGAKSVAIGLSTLETIRHLHGPRIMEHPLTRAGQLDGNLLQRELREIHDLAPAQFAINVTLSRERQLTGVFSGTVHGAHRRAVEFIERFVRIRVPIPYDVVVTTNAGFPLDVNFYQCVKGMLTAARITRPGGTIVMAARCPEGLGSAEFAELMTSFASSHDAMQTILNPEFFCLDQWAVGQVCQVRRRAEILFYTEGIARDVLEKCLVRPVASLKDGLRLALERHGPNARVAVIPKGPYVNAELEADDAAAGLA